MSKSVSKSAARAGDRLTLSVPTLFPATRALPVCAIDLGFSHGSKSCGFAASNQETAVELHFGQLVTELRKWIERVEERECTLILEAPLSHAYHAPEKPTSRSGNPTQRAFERGENFSGLEPRKRCPWYTGAGAGMSLAALRLLAAIKDLPVRKTIHLFEGFQPRWEIPGCPTSSNDHRRVAEQLLHGYSAGLITGQTCDGIKFSRNLAAMAGAQVSKGQESSPPWIVFASAELFKNFKFPLQTNPH